jgi:hypothetical protein
MVKQYVMGGSDLILPKTALYFLQMIDTIKNLFKTNDLT